MSALFQAFPEDVDQIWRRLQESFEDVEELGGHHSLLIPGESICLIPRGEAISTDNASVQLAQFATILENALQEKSITEATRNAMRVAEGLLESGDRRAFPPDVGDIVQVKMTIRGARYSLDGYHVVPSDLSVGILVCGIAKGYKNLLQSAKQKRVMRSLQLEVDDTFAHAVLYQVVRTDMTKDAMQVWEAQIAYDPNIDGVIPLD